MKALGITALLASFLLFLMPWSGAFAMGFLTLLFALFVLLLGNLRDAGHAVQEGRDDAPGTTPFTALEDDSLSTLDDETSATSAFSPAEEHCPAINPATGLPMVGCAVDIEGNPYGTGSIDSDFGNDTYPEIGFSHDDDWNHGGGFSDD